MVLSSNGRVKPDVVLVNGTEELHPEGAYYLEWREGQCGFAYLWAGMLRIRLQGD
jgi:hypothetical protein